MRSLCAIPTPSPDRTTAAIRFTPAYVRSSFEETHRGLETLLRPGERVRVYYDLGTPGRSMLSVGFYSSTLTSLFGGILFFTVGIGFLLIVWFAIAGRKDIVSGITLIR